MVGWYLIVSTSERDDNQLMSQKKGDAVDGMSKSDGVVGMVLYMVGRKTESFVVVFRS